jgi:hypothetical protein
MRDATIMLDDRRTFGLTIVNWRCTIMEVESRS